MLRITKDRPGKQLSFENMAEPFLSVKGRLGYLGFILLIFIAVGILGYVISDTPKDTLPRIFLAMIVLSFLVIRKVVFPRKGILTFHADSDKSRLEIALGLPGYPPSRNQVIAFEDIERVRFVVPHGMKRGSAQNIPFELWVHSSEQKFKQKVQISSINTDVELSDIILRLANIIQLPYYRVVVNDPQNFQICITHAAEKGSQSVPEILKPADYAQDVVDASVTPPPQVVSLEGVEALPPTLQARVWASGQKIEIVKKWQIDDFLRLAGALLAVTAAVILWIWPDLVSIFVSQPNEEQRLVFNMLRFPVFFGGGAYAGWMLLSIRYCCRLDFKACRAKIRLRGGWKQFNFAEVKEIVLTQKTHTSSSNNRGSRKTTYSHRLEAKLQNDTSYRLMFDRDSSRLSQCKRHYNELWPFTATLAKLLNVQARYDD